MLLTKICIKLLMQQELFGKILSAGVFIIPAEGSSKNKESKTS